MAAHTLADVANLGLIDASELARATDLPGAKRHSSDQVVDEVTGSIMQKVQAQLDSANGMAVRQSVRTGNFELTNSHFHWLDLFAVAKEDRPEWALVLERQANGRFYGIPTAFLIDGKVVASDPAVVWGNSTNSMTRFASDGDGESVWKRMISEP